MEEHSEELDAIESLPAVEFAIGDSVVYPHHGAGQVVRKEVKEVLGERREYLTIKILHNDMTVMVPTANAARAGLRRVIDEEKVKKVLAVLQDKCSEMPKNWNRRFKHNRDKIKTGDVYELAEVVRNLAIREAEKGLSTGEKQMFTRARKILASELMYALGMTAEQVEVHLDSLLLDSSGPASAALSSNGKMTAAASKLRAPGKAGVGGLAATNGKIATAGGLPSLDGDLALAPE
jgi:CarD family transcriptional regulator